MEPTEPQGTEGGPISEQEVIDALDNLGFENDEARGLLIQYTEQCEREVESKMILDPGNEQATLSNNRAKIEGALKIGILYSKTRNYKEEATDYLDDVLTMALQHESTQDLATQIILLIEDLSKSEE